MGLKVNFSSDFVAGARAAYDTQISKVQRDDLTIQPCQPSNAGKVSDLQVSNSSSI